MASKEHMRLTDTAIARLRPREREYTVWDARVVGLGVRVRPSGGASFVLLRRTEGQSRRLSLGSVASRGVDDIRRQCHALMAKQECDKTPQSVHETPLFRDFVAGTWKDVHRSSYKTSTEKGVKHCLASQLLPVFGSTPLNRITRGQLLRWFSAYSQTAPGGANSALKLLRQILNFAIACGHIDTNPARGVQPNRCTPRTRFLSHAELRRLHCALDEHSGKDARARPETDIIRLLLLTGCRKSEILWLRWCEVEGDALLLRDAKTGPRKVHLNVQARRIIKRQPRGMSAFVFPSWRHSDRPRSHYLRLWEVIRREAEIEDVRIHDLRHYSRIRFIPGLTPEAGEERARWALVSGIITGCSGMPARHHRAGIVPVACVKARSGPSPALSVSGRRADRCTWSRRIHGRATMRSPHGRRRCEEAPWRTSVDYVLHEIVGIRARYTPWMP